MGLEMEEKCFYTASMLEALEEQKRIFEGWGAVL